MTPDISEVHNSPKLKTGLVRFLFNVVGIIFASFIPCMVLSWNYGPLILEHGKYFPTLLTDSKVFVYIINTVPLAISLRTILSSWINQEEADYDDLQKRYLIALAISYLILASLLIVK